MWLSIDAVFYTLLTLTIGLYLACYLIPRSMVRFNSVPWAFHLGKNIDLRYQSVLYSAFHRHSVNHASHLTLVADQLWWFVLLWFVHPFAVIAVLVLIGVQSILIGDRRLGLLAGVTGLFIAAAGFGLVHWLGAESARHVAFVGLLVGCSLRFFGHLFEPMPPGLSEDNDRFRPFKEARFSARFLALPAIGIVSEFAAGLPCRLFVVQLFWLADRFRNDGDNPAGERWQEHMLAAEKIHQTGWTATPTTAWMSAQQQEESLR